MAKASASILVRFSGRPSTPRQRVSEINSHPAYLAPPQTSASKVIFVPMTMTLDNLHNSPLIADPSASSAPSAPSPKSS